MNIDKLRAGFHLPGSGPNQNTRFLLLSFCILFTLALYPPLALGNDAIKARNMLNDEYIPFTTDKFWHYVFMNEVENRQTFPYWWDVWWNSRPTRKKSPSYGISQKRWCDTRLVKPAVPSLKKALKDPDVHTRNSARSALNRVDPGNKATMAAASSQSPSRRTPAKISASLFKDVKELAETLSAKVPVVYELIIYGDFAMAITPESSSRDGYGTYTYRNGQVSGPNDGRANCKAIFQTQDVDFSMLPRLVEKAPGQSFDLPTQWNNHLMQWEIIPVHLLKRYRTHISFTIHYGF